MSTASTRWLPLGAGLGAIAVPTIALPLGGLADGAIGLGLAIGGLTLFVASVVVGFSIRYLRADTRAGAFGTLLGLIVGCVLTCALTNNVIVLALAWICSGQLLARMIGHDRDWSEARAAARRAALAFALGDGAMIAGLALLAVWAGSIQLSIVLNRANTLPYPIVASTALLLVIAAAARCALPPFSGWLASSMTAPTPVSALMHAGLVNAGGFLLIRFAPVLEAAPVARFLAVALGLTAVVFGLGVMLVRPDVKRALAGSTISQMGFMVMTCGLGAYAAALWHLIAHGLFKAWMFLGSGSAIGLGKAPDDSAMVRSISVMAPPVVGLALALAWAGQMSAALVPLLLALATAAVTLRASLGAALPTLARCAAIALLIAMGASELAGLRLTTMAVGHDGPKLLGGWALIGLLAAFLFGWAWQARRPSMHPRLYVHLLNAGSLRPPLEGDAA